MYFIWNCNTHSHNLLCLCWLSNFLFSHLPQTLFSNSYTRKKMRNIYYFILFSLIIQLCLIQTIVLHMANLLFFLIWRSLLCDNIVKYLREVSGTKHRKPYKWLYKFSTTCYQIVKNSSLNTEWFHSFCGLKHDMNDFLAQLLNSLLFKCLCLYGS